MLKNIILFINRQQVRRYFHMLEFFNQFEKEYPRTIISFLYLLNSLGKFWLLTLSFHFVGKQAEVIAEPW